MNMPELNLTLALKDVANIHGGIGKVAEAANLNRESLYRMLSEDGNPTVNSLNALLHTLGLRWQSLRTSRRRLVDIEYQT
jgi:DNA-binding phage protein